MSASAFFAAFILLVPLVLGAGVFIGWRSGRQDHDWAAMTRRMIDGDLGMKTYKVEVKAHFDDDGKQKAMEEACKDAARNLLSIAILLSAPRSTPEAMVQTEDWIAGITKHDLQDQPTTSDATS